MAARVSEVQAFFIHSSDKKIVIFSITLSYQFQLLFQCELSKTRRNAEVHLTPRAENIIIYTVVLSYFRKTEDSSFFHKKSALIGSGCLSVPGLSFHNL